MTSPFTEKIYLYAWSSSGACSSPNLNTIDRFDYSNTSCLDGLTDQFRVSLSSKSDQCLKEELVGNWKLKIGHTEYDFNKPTLRLVSGWNSFNLNPDYELYSRPQCVDITLSDRTNNLGTTTTVITNNDTPVIDGAEELGSQATLFNRSESIGMATVYQNDDFSIISLKLLDNSYKLTAIAEDAVRNILVASNSLNVAISKDSYDFSKRSDLKTSADLYISNESSTLDNYGHISKWDVSQVNAFLNRIPLKKDLYQTLKSEKYIKSKEMR